MFSGGNRGKSVTSRSAPDESSFTVDTTGASYRLEMGSLDRHSQGVFPNYAEAIRHARDHQLPTIPSTPLVLATCAAIDTRLHAALLARTQPAAWKDQLVFARALHGEITGPSFESLSTSLAGISEVDLGSAEAVDSVGKEASRLRPDTGFAPAALAHASSPEQQVLEPLGMAAWDDPMAALIAAIRSGNLDLKPKADDGFYRHRWFALETLAAPGKAPECHKLQLSAEPSPIVYLRLARAYQKLAADLAAANHRLWRSLRDADGRPLAAELDERVLRLHGLARIVYQEVGFSTPESESDQSIDPSAAVAAATTPSPACAAPSIPKIQVNSPIRSPNGCNGCEPLRASSPASPHGGCSAGGGVVHGVG